MNIISLDFAECSASLSGHWKRFSKYRSGKVLRKPCQCTPRDETRASFVITVASFRNLWRSLREREREREILHRLADIEDKWFRWMVSFVNNCPKFVKINQRIEINVFERIFCKSFLSSIPFLGIIHSNQSLLQFFLLFFVYMSEMYCFMYEIYRIPWFRYVENAKLI